MAASQRSRSTAAQLDVDDQAAADQLMTMMRRPAAVLQDEAAAEEEASAAAADLQLELRRGPWTVDEDLTLVNYIADHGEGRWNSLARAAGNLIKSSCSQSIRCRFDSNYIWNR
ncbi:Os12g0564100 [Oryza sativa Japonica Group]|jgi:hypothetical protein|uniref:Os12g0564100 protein n=1 Tax=Oryza sativa subsp. japonica TaxID=39947 RepID=A0A0P0YBD3_ORYSJ|nr:hypothetical protein EE612_060303 [Oryza sativa]BAT17672.1 Os12g0564100 [Oryza sativa Japonica Group]